MSNDYRSKLPPLPTYYSGTAVAKELYDVIVKMIQIELHNAMADMELNINVKQGSGDNVWNSKLNPKRY